MSNIYSWQQDIWQRLRQRGEFRSHALLLKGKKGIGKYEFARYLAKSLLCSAPIGAQRACGKCLSCRWFEQNGHPNFYQIVPEALAANPTGQHERGDNEKKSNNSINKAVSQQISIDQIRRLEEFVYMTGHQNGYKIILIYPAETMNSSAANALLKKLEEPPENVLFILVAHQSQSLMPTIRSRCQQINMPIPDIGTAVEWLKQDSVNDPQIILANVEFPPLSALLLDKDRSTVYYQEKFIQQIANPNFNQLDLLSLTASLQTVKLSIIVNWLQKWCYDLTSYLITGKIRYHLNQMPAIQAISGRIDLHAFIDFTRALDLKQQLSHHPHNSRLFLEEILISYAALILEGSNSD